METLPDLLQIPEPSYTIFERPPLVLALCQIRFTRDLSVADRTSVAAFQRAIREHYPVLLERRHVRVRFTQAPGEATVDEDQPTRQWQFGDGEDNWSVVLAEDFVALETRAYERFSHFLERLRYVLDALIPLMQPRWTRVGLRYINEIRPIVERSIDVVQPQWLGPLGTPELIGHAARVQAIQQISLRFGDDQGITISHGLLPEGSTVQPRADATVPSGPFYLLDFDAFREALKPGGELIDIEMTCQQIQSFNRACYKLFRWAITDQYTTTLGERTHAD